MPPVSNIAATSKVATPENNTNKYLLIASVVTGTAAIAAVLVYALTRRPAKSQQSNEATKQQTEQASENKVSKVNRETIVKIFSEITTRMQHVIMRLAQEEQRVMQSGSELGATPEQLQRFLMQRFQESVTEVEKDVYTEFNVTEDDVKIASEVYGDDPNLVRVINQLKTVYNAVMGPVQTVPVPDFMTLDKTLEILKKTMDILRIEAKSLKDKLEKKGISQTKDLSKFTTEFQQLYAVAVEESRDKLYQEFGINDDAIVQAAVVKYQNDIKFQTDLKSYSEIHNKKMAELGFYPAGMQ